MKVLKTNSKKALSALLVLSLVTVSIAVTPFGIGTVSADSITATHAQRIVSSYQGTWTTPPTDSNFSRTPDSPLMGNGDVGVAMVGNINSMVMVLGKNEFWSLVEGQVKAMARLNISVPSMAGASYLAEQKLASAQVNGTFGLAGNTIKTESWVQATDTANNMLMTKFTYTGTGTKAVAISLARGNENTFASSTGSSGDVLYLDVRGDAADTLSGYNTRRARIATRVIGTTGAISGSTLNFTMSPGDTYTLITSIMSNYDNASYQTAAISNINTKTQANVDTLKASHQSWWNTFYGKSFIEIPNKTIEKSYYASLYLMGSTSRAGEMAPGIWGNWLARNGEWRGDYHLNYNYEVPFYFALPTNHIELAENYDKPVVDWIPKGQAAATANGYTGVFYGVGIGPLPNGSGDTNIHGQKSNAAYAATNMIMRFYSSYDTTYASSVYNYLKQSALFWQNYLVWDGAHYDIVNDAQHEGDVYPQTNGVMSLGLVRYLLQGCIDISVSLNQDTALRATWQNILNTLSPFPTFTRNSQTVFRYTEVGRDWNGDNSIGIQHIYPGGQIGLSSEAATLQTARNMIGQMARWNDGNGSNTFYPAAARVGYDPATILSQLNSFITGNSFNNMHIHTNGGGIENFNTVPAAMSEMMLQSFQNKLRIFPNWPSNTNAKYGDLRASGAYLVSSEIRNNQVQYVRIISEKGRTAAFVNPWVGQTIRVYRNGVDAGTVSGAEISLATAVNETIHLAPNGTSLATINSMMSQTLAGGGTSPGNVALNKTATASDVINASESADKAVDANGTTKWTSNPPSSTPGDKWLKVNLGGTFNITRWVVKHAGSNGEAATYNTKNFKLQKSNDGNVWTDVDAVTNNTAASTDRTVASFSASYVRLYITTSVQDGTGYVTVPGDRSNARIYEFEVYGT
ncbi:discoidin domain-containing protein [Paenibacillus psychroresistens]|uniref:Discoidin domain-containing protein n=1 Tax=Paenibacillus psychroresistens TaxID=1778678 RepID=A0A6B8RFV1_9BACL|nr:discoidin domain-containing protein [Paenibacillus psychroresistens]QGQ94403.1 discoidin domain-containing protein [Paenibacillus psychroresistens]